MSEKPFIRGQWHAFDRVRNYLNTLDTEIHAATELKTEIYSEVMGMRPENEHRYGGIM